MKNMRSNIIKNYAAVLGFLAAILCIPRVANADVVLEWNAIAVDTFYFKCVIAGA